MSFNGGRMNKLIWLKIVFLALIRCVLVIYKAQQFGYANTVDGSIEIFARYLPGNPSERIYSVTEITPHSPKCKS